ncbi:MAG: PQQ-dependent sugar dehydrogenase [Luminiphilus sp.]|jgi:glucose/arabinose dehydrogenase|nr:PQQ-dependent sugar dehydrogenase [Luminiphilus sp.]
MLLRLIKTFVCILSSALLTHVAHADIEIQTIAEGFDTPWSLAELPNNQGFLVTERPGGLHHVSGEGEIQSISGVPDVFAKRQGGLFDVVLHPNFEANNVIFLAYAAGSEDSNRTTVAKATLMASELTDLSVIFEVTPNKKGGGHFGGRMAFLDDGTLLLSVGEGYTLREDAQKKESQLGKLLRMTETGEAPADNPFTDAPFVYSYGHRNPQGLIVDAPTQTIWMTEHGPKGGDELNQITAGKNYGWPAITYGVDYSGAIISPFTEAPGMEQPVTYWVPSIATSGLALYTSDAMPELKGKLLVGGLKSKNVVAVDVSGDEALVSEPFPGFEGRIRDVRMLNDGSIAVIDEEAGKVVRISAGAD